MGMFMGFLAAAPQGLDAAGAEPVVSTGVAGGSCGGSMAPRGAEPLAGPGEAPGDQGWLLLLPLFSLN